MDFKKACYFYVQNYSALKNRKQARKLVSTSYQLLQYKRKKLKTGSTTFVFKQLFYGDWLITQWFEMEFTNQTGSSDLQKGVERTLSMLDWSWDFKNLLLLGVISTTLFNYLTSYVEDYYNSCIAGNFEEVVIRTGLEAVFTKAAPRRIDGSINPMLDLTSSIVDVAMVFDLF